MRHGSSTGADDVCGAATRTTPFAPPVLHVPQGEWPSLGRRSRLKFADDTAVDAAVVPRGVGFARGQLFNPTLNQRLRL